MELKASIGIVTLETNHASEAAAKLIKLVVLSEGVKVDGSFAWQILRKFV